MSLEMAQHEREEGGTFENMTSGGLIIDNTEESAFIATVRYIHLLIFNRLQN
jgi:hypothetical protein